MEEDDEPDHRTAPVYLRHMLSHTQWHHMAPQSRPACFSHYTADTPVNGQTHNDSLKISKSVSFAKVESIIGGEFSC